MQAEFVGDLFSWKRMGLPKVGVGAERHRFRVKGIGKGGESKGSQRPACRCKGGEGWVVFRHMARGQVAGHPSQAAREPRVPSLPSPQSFILRTYIVVGIGWE